MRGLTLTALRALRVASAQDTGWLPRGRCLELRLLLAKEGWQRNPMVLAVAAAVSVRVAQARSPGP